MDSEQQSLPTGKRSSSRASSGGGTNNQSGDGDSLQFQKYDRGTLPVPDRIHILPGAFLSNPNAFLQFNYASSDQSVESRLPPESLAPSQQQQQSQSQLDIGNDTRPVVRTGKQSPPQQSSSPPPAPLQAPRQARLGKGSDDDNDDEARSRSDSRPRYPQRQLSRLPEDIEPPTRQKGGRPSLSACCRRCVQIGGGAGWTRRWHYILIGFAVLGVTLLATGIGVAVQQGRSNGGSNNSGGQNGDGEGITSRETGGACVLEETKLFECGTTNGVEVPVCAGNTYLLLQSTMMPTVYRESFEGQLSIACSPVRLALIQTSVALTNSPGLDAQQYYLLTLLYLSTLGSGWTQRLGWLSHLTDPCSWIGVACTGVVGASRSRVVTRIDLSSNGLVGSLPTEIGRLTSLRK